MGYYFKSKNIKLKLKSSALGYAITFSLLIGLVCSGMLFISSVNKRLEINYITKEYLIFNNLFALNYGAKLKEKTSETIYHASGDTSNIQLKKWGAFQIAVAKTFNGNKSIEKSALIGTEKPSTLPSLYLSDNGQPLKLGGATKIEGIAFLPERGVERAYISGKNYLNKELVYGEKKKSDRFLPKLNTEFSNLNLESFIKDVVKIDDIQKDTVFSFNNPTTLFSTIEAIYIRNNIKGNVIIHSFDSIYVSAESSLQNVILISPIVHFEKGFKGNVQVVAHQSISCEEGVRLTYPSTLVLNEEQSYLGLKSATIFIDENVQVRGGVLLLSKVNNFRKPVRLFIAEKSTLSGIVYNQGTTEIKGVIIGSLYTNAFDLKTAGGQYSNHIVDAEISSKKLPDSFMIPNWLEVENNRPSRIIERF